MHLIDRRHFFFGDQARLTQNQSALIGQQRHLSRFALFALYRRARFAVFEQCQIGLARVLAQKPIIKYAAHHGRSMRRTKTSIFHNRGNRNRRFISGCKSHVQRVIALVFFNPARVVALFLPDRRSLRGAGFTSADIGRATEDALRSTLSGDAYQGFAHSLNILRLVA